MPRQPWMDCDDSLNNPTPPDGKRDVVITPAGPMLKEHVNPVGPDEIIHRNEDGTYTIIPKQNESQ